MNNNILLKNITQKEIAIDLVTIPVEEDFKGFYSISRGPHYITVNSDDGKPVGVWCYFEGKEGVVAKSYNAEKQVFEEWNDNEAKSFKKLALDEEMDDEMISYPSEIRQLWSPLVLYIKELGKIPSLNLSNTNEYSFSGLLEVVHNGNIVALLAEFQFSFVRMAISTFGEEDGEAIQRWKDMMKIIYSATEEEIDKYSLFYIQWINVLFDQFETLPDRTFQRTGESTTYNVIVKNAATLCDKLMKCSDEETVISGKRLRLYLTQRGAQL